MKTAGDKSYIWTVSMCSIFSSAFSSFGRATFSLPTKEPQYRNFANFCFLRGGKSFSWLVQDNCEWDVWRHPIPQGKDSWKWEIGCGPGDWNCEICSWEWGGYFLCLFVVEGALLSMCNCSGCVTEGWGIDRRVKSHRCRGKGIRESRSELGDWMAKISLIPYNVYYNNLTRMRRAWSIAICNFERSIESAGACRL